MNSQSTLVESFFYWQVNHRKKVIIFGFLLLSLSIFFLTKITKDTRADAFLSPTNPALVYRDKVKDLFGLSDPFVIAVVAKDTIFNIEGLETIQQITNEVYSIDNIDPDRITSLATENNIYGDEDGMMVEPFFSDSIDEFTASKVQDAIRDFPLYQGSLVSTDETASIIVAELIDESLAEETYQQIIEKVNTLIVPEGIELHVAGEGAIAGYLGSYIDADAQRLNPIAGIIISLVIFLAFFRFASMLSANVVIAAAALITLGLMSAFAIPFYVITNALPVILIGIAVADSIHIYSEYFERRFNYPKESINDSVVSAMVSMWRPVTLTTLTTSAGFLGLYFAAYMPPFKYFGLFAAIGVVVAWLYSMTVLPALMATFKTPVHSRFIVDNRNQSYDMFAALLVWIGKLTLKYSKNIIFVSLIISAIGVYSALKISVNDDRIDTFHPSEDLYRADKVINGKFDGTNYIDIVVQTNEVEGIFEPDVLKKIEALQQFSETLPYVTGSTSVVDYLKQMHRSLNRGDQNFYVLPDNKDLIAQYFLLYSSSSDPADFEEEIDYDYQQANVRVVMNTGAFEQNRVAIESLNQYIESEFNSPQVVATLSGRVNLNYHWIKDLGSSHFQGMAIALFLVFLVSAVLFKSPLAGIYALIPISTTLLFVYAVMVWTNIPLGIGTSMFAAVAIGLGVDFAIHTIDRLKNLYKSTGDLSDTLIQFYPTTGRALFFNLMALALGFGVLVTSKVVPLNNFGLIVMVSVSTSFIVSMTLLPALVKNFRPSFIIGGNPRGTKSALIGKSTAAIIALATVAYTFNVQQVKAEELPNAGWIIDQVNAVDEGQQVTRKLSMTLTDKRGKVRQRDTFSYRKYFGNEKRTVLYYLSPTNVKDTGFLTYDYSEVEEDDDQWLYLPAMRKSRRISASDRGDYFLGTDFTYEDIKNEGKIEKSDYQFKTIGKEIYNGVTHYHIELISIDNKTAKELGYGKGHIWVNADNWIIVKAEYWDTKLNPLKILEVSEIYKVNGIWTRHQLTINNLKTGHRTEFKFYDVDYLTPVDDRVFSRQSLSRGAPL